MPRPTKTFGNSVRWLRRMDALGVTVGTIASAMAAFLTGMAALQGPVVTNWKTTCAIAAVFSLAAGIATGLHKTLGIANRLARASDCAGKLRALEVALTMSAGRPDAEVGTKCAQLAADYPDILVE
jgi:hypothetical protein